MTATPESSSFDFDALEEHVELFAQMPDKPLCLSALWSLWAQRLEHEPQQRELLRAVGTVLTQRRTRLARFNTTDGKEGTSRAESPALNAGLPLPPPQGTGEAFLWHHLLLHGGTHRLRAAQAWIKGGFDPWKDETSTPLTLLLATGDGALCTFLFQRLPPHVLEARSARTFTQPLSVGSEQCGEPDPPLYGLARWCLQHEARIETGEALAAHLGTSLTALPAVHQVRLAGEAATKESVVRWWRLLHANSTPPPLPLSLLNHLITRLEPEPLTRKDLLHLEALFGAPDQKASASFLATLSAEEERTKKMQKNVVKQQMKNALRDTSGPKGRGLLGSLSAFLNEKGIHWSKHINNSHYKHLSDKELFLFQTQVRAWVQTLPLETTLDFKKATWSIPAVVLRELFRETCMYAGHATGNFGKNSGAPARHHLTWMTIILNTLWEEASPALQQRWMRGDVLPRGRGTHPDMTRPFIFWWMRLQACVATVEPDLPALLLPHTLGRPDTQGLTRFHLKQHDTQVTELMEGWRENLWHTDRKLHPEIWETPSLFNAERLEVLWAPYVKKFSRGWTPSSLDGPLINGLARVLNDPSYTPERCLTFFTLAQSLLLSAFLFRFKFDQISLEERLTPYQPLLSAVKTWFTDHPEERSAWCTVNTGLTLADDAWRMFWEQQFLDLALPSDEKSVATHKKRVRV